jgi:hypothetical protein
MASSTQQTVKQEPSGSSEQSTANTTVKQEFSVTAKEEDETFEQFYSEVIYL